MNVYLTSGNYHCEEDLKGSKFIWMSDAFTFQFEKSLYDYIVDITFRANSFSPQTLSYFYKGHKKTVTRESDIFSIKLSVCSDEYVYFVSDFFLPSEKIVDSKDTRKLSFQLISITTTNQFETKNISLENLSYKTQSFSNDIALMTVFFNPGGFKNLRNNFDVFHKKLSDSGLNIYVCEILSKNSQGTPLPPDLVTLQLHSDEFIWHKERALNLLEPHIPKKFQKLIYSDCDLLWKNDMWWKLASQKLETCGAVQCFGNMHYMLPDETIEYTIEGTAKAFLTNSKVNNNPGAVWAVHRDFFSKYGGLYDLNILGGGDEVTTKIGFLGDISHNAYLANTTEETRNKITDWYKNVFPFFRKNVGYIEEDIYHMFHGNFKNRHYTSRYEILRDFYPNHLEISKNGLFEWSPSAPASIKEAVKQFFYNRKEDTNEIK